VTNSEGRTGDISEAFKGVDVVVAASKQDLAQLNLNAVKTWQTRVWSSHVQPNPEIWPWEPRAGACIIATGRNDFPNQVNNSLAFRNLPRRLDVKAKTLQTTCA